jgi:hypothetical protein
MAKPQIQPPHECKNEERLRKLEQQEAVMGVKIENLIEKLGIFNNPTDKEGF